MPTHAADGSINISVVTGAAITGLTAADGSMNVVTSPGTIVQQQHPCGARYVTNVAGGVVGYYAANGSMNVAVSPYVATGAVRVTVVSGVL